MAEAGDDGAGRDRRGLDFRRAQCSGTEASKTPAGGPVPSNRPFGSSRGTEPGLARKGRGTGGPPPARAVQVSRPGEALTGERSPDEGNATTARETSAERGLDRRTGRPGNPGAVGPPVRPEGGGAPISAVQGTAHCRHASPQVCCKKVSIVSRHFPHRRQEVSCDHAPFPPAPRSSVTEAGSERSRMTKRRCKNLQRAEANGGPRTEVLRPVMKPASHGSAEDEESG